MVIDDADRQVWEMTTASIPRLNIALVVVVAVLNLIMPGLGTIVAACAGQETVSKTQMSIGVVQFFTSLFLVGFIWAQYWSYLIYVKSQDDQLMGQPQFIGGGQ